MTKSELIDQIYYSSVGYDLSRNQIAGVLSCLAGVVRVTLCQGGEIPLPELGKLKIQKTAARPGRNPKTGAPIPIPAGRKVVFRAGKEFRDILH